MPLSSTAQARSSLTDFIIKMRWIKPMTGVDKGDIQIDPDTIKNLKCMITLLLALALSSPACTSAKVKASLVSGGTTEYEVETTFNADDIILNRLSMDATRQLVVFTPTENVRSVEYVAVKSDLTCDDSLPFSADPPMASTTYLTSDGTWKVCIRVITNSGTKNIISSNNFIVDFTVPTLIFTSTVNGSSQTPSIQGTATESAIVTLYSDALCSSPISAAASSAVFESSGITTNTLVAGVVADIYAMGTDLAGNISSCSKITTVTPSSSSPRVSSLSPTSGVLAGGTAITITGTGFLSGALVSIGGNACTSISVLSASQITCTTPSHGAGAVTVSVTNTDTQSGSLASGFTYQAAPVVSSLSPTSGVLAGGTAITITGTGFLSGAAVSIGGSACTSVSVSSATSITCTTPSHAAGAVTVSVTNTDTQSGSLVNGFTYTPEKWTATVTVTGTLDTPPGRYQHSAVWTGSKMIVWGGFNGSAAVNTGGRYDPVANIWSETKIENAPGERYFHVAVWTGSKMIIWGGIGAGYLNTGGQYDPDGDAWTSTSVGANVPAGRYAPTAIWTGSKMVVWGGSITSDYYNTGGRYDPVDDLWASTATTSAPLKRAYATAVWTGSKMIVWGGFSSSGSRWLNSGGVYDPVDDLWAVTSTGSAPSGRSYHTAVWTGSKMIVWGGDSNGWFNNDGALYDSAANSWAAMTTTNSPSGRTKQTAVWTGSNMILWGGLRYEGENATALDSGGIYTPPASSTTNSWTDTVALNAPLSRWGQSSVWTGSKMIVWAGYRGGRGLFE